MDAIAKRTQKSSLIPTQLAKSLLQIPNPIALAGGGEGSASNRPS